MTLTAPRPRLSRRSRWLGGLAALTLSAGIATVAAPGGADAATSSSGGWTTSAATPKSAAVGSTVTITVTVSSSTTRRGLVDLELYNTGARTFQQFWDNQSFTAGTARSFTTTWKVPASEPLGSHTVKVGVFQPGWASFQHWNDQAASFTVTAAGTTTTAAPTTTVRPTTSTAAPTTTVRPTTTTIRPTTTTVRPTTTTIRPTTTTAAPTTTVRPTTTTAAPTTTIAPTGHFSTLPVGASLPSDAQCAAAVRKASEVRADNANYNKAPGQSTSTAAGPLFARVDGNFSGTTDEIIQWTACKWGIDEDIVRAQAAMESYWHQSTGGDFTTDSSRCAPGHPIGADGRAGQCAESAGLLQVRFPYWGSAFPAASTSTAYNADYAYASWRSCFEGQYTWLNTVERGSDYGAGDVWGCVGLWFAGRWHTTDANNYASTVQSYLSQRIWTTQSFING